ncbi:MULTISPECIES: hypothetical protein [Kamptonema]|uniref:hypothetical protein n=1 Tax=Kamptonema TaxID=1501433 RepID=UPI0001DAD112|nr:MULTISPECIES: hypothetical protein [Kamptonema]CBN58808.1 hypothetical protein OSCI_3890024 [Kamptonema sp. PCC 6506]
MKVYQKSLWKETYTSFDEFQKIIKNIYSDTQLEVLVLGCSDGKYVFPFLKEGYRVTAVDNDSIALYGGEVEFQGQNIKVEGLINNLKYEGYDNSQCKIVHQNYMDLKNDNLYHVVLTSCSWHYKKNFCYSFGEIIDKMQSFVEKDGLFLADYFMPIKEKHFLYEHYLKPGKILDFFKASEWKIILDLDVGIIEEAPHVFKDEWHQHHYGAFVAKKKEK